MLHIDFETRSKVDIWRAGAWEYAAHPSTEILCLAYAIDDGPVKLIPMFDTGPFIQDNNLDLMTAISQNIPICGHNVFFEYAIWYHILHKKHGWVMPDERRFRCTMAQASACSLPKGLADVAEALRLSAQKDLEGKRVMKKLCKPRKITKYNSQLWHEDPEDFEVLYDYCRQDVAVERMVAKALPDLNPTEQEVWFLDQTINRRGFKVDLEGVNAALSLIDEYSLELTAEICKLSNGYIDKASRVQRIKYYLSDNGIEVEDLTKQTVDTLLLDKTLPYNIRRVLEIRRQLGRTSVKKYQAMVDASSSDDHRVRDTLFYHAASTGRWGGKLVQPQNLPKSIIKDIHKCVELMKHKNLDLMKMSYPDVMGAISSAIRGMIVAEDGHDLVVADYKSIEARVLLWLADDQPALAKYYAGEDLYVDMAKAIFKKEDISKSERDLGKTAILGCGYGMGANKFHATCTAWGQDVSFELAHLTVGTYRQKYRSVIKLWYAQEKAAVYAVQHPNKIITQGKVKWCMRKNFLICQLPSKRTIVYYEPVVKRVDTGWGEKWELSYSGMDSQTKQFKSTHTYGGKLVENMTQGIARDIMAHAMLTLEREEYPVIMTVHDEIVVEVEQPRGDEAEMVHLMCLLPDWAKGCPIDAEGWTGERYKK